MRENLYVEHRKWEFFWGLLLDSEKEINGIIKHYNEKGWNCIHVMTSMPNVSIFMKILIIAINLISLGFISYWGGATFLFERDKDGKGVYEEIVKTNAMLAETLGSMSVNIGKMAGDK
jgi:hypothetical protein